MAEIGRMKGEPEGIPAGDADTGDERVLAGLSAGEVAERVERGAVNVVESPTSRNVREILRANLLTRFNLLVGSLVVVIFVIGQIQDAVFGLVMVVNAIIGIVQEIRAKRALDRLALVVAPRTRVIREGVTGEVPPEQVVIDDLIALARGDQVVVDGVVEQSNGLELDESLLTGESDPRIKSAGDRCLSGSFVLAGSGIIRADRVGEDAYAARLAQEARRFDLVESELRRGTDRILRWIGWVLPPTAILLAWSQVQAADGWRAATRGAVAGTVGMIPQGLVLLISLALAVGVARLARRGVLTQELAALEGLARVDVVCFDKTGTLTEGVLRVISVDRLDPALDPAPALAALADSEPFPNASLRAIAEAFPAGDRWQPVGRVPFRSDRRWSGADFGKDGVWVLGAPEVLLRSGSSEMGRAESAADAGHRVLVLARGDRLDGDHRGKVDPAALVIIGDSVRADAAETVRYFAEQGVALKVISGDHPRTVAAIARSAGIGGEAVDGSELPAGGKGLDDAVELGSGFGRGGPAPHPAMVETLQAHGHVVAMTGDGVNDVLSLKSADVGIAMGGGTAAARTVAPLVLVEGRFSRLPDIVAEGRRVIGNIERVGSLYVTKTIYATLLAWAVGLVRWEFPLLPRHYTVIGAFTIGIPSFWLALEPSSARARPGFVGRILRFGLPVGTLTAMTGFAVFWMSRAESVSLGTARAVTTLGLLTVGLFAVVLVSRPLNPVRRLVVAAMAVGSMLVFAVPPLREFYAVDLPRPVVVLATFGVVALAGSVMYTALRMSGWWHDLPKAIRQLERLAGLRPGARRQPRVEPRVVSVAGDAHNPQNRTPERTADPGRSEANPERVKTGPTGLG